MRGKPNSWVALSTCDGLSGVIFDGTEMHYIEKSAKTSGLESPHFLYKHSDLIDNNKTCGYDGDAHDHEHEHEHKDNRILRVNIFIIFHVILHKLSVRQIKGNLTKILYHR